MRDEPRILHAHSRDARRELDTCYLLTCRNSARGGKMLRCGACKAVIYCSKECQKEDWPKHKPACRRIQGEKKAVEDISKSHNSASPSLKQIEEELRAFMHRFGPTLLLSAVNWFRPKPRDKAIEGWEEDCLLLWINRRPNVPDGAPAWARFQVDEIARLSAEETIAAFSELGIPPTTIGKYLRERKVHLQEARRRGPGNGLFDIYVQCQTSYGLIHGHYPLAFSPAVASSSFLPPGITPENHFKREVKKHSESAMQGFVRSK